METNKSPEHRANEYASTNIDNEKSVFRGLSTQYQDDIFDAVESAYLSGYNQALTDLSTSNTELREALREAVANYMQSEGCSCCRDIEAHELHTEALGKLLDVEKYEDCSGYDFSKYRTKP